MVSVQILVNRVIDFGYIDRQNEQNDRNIIGHREISRITKDREFDPKTNRKFCGGLDSPWILSIRRMLLGWILKLDSSLMEVRNLLRFHQIFWGVFCI